MPAPTVVSVSPVANATDVVLGTDIQVTFDQVIDTTTVLDSTFSITGPGQTAIITPDNLIAANPDVTTGRQFITGTFAFTTDTVSTPNRTIVTFNPDNPLEPNQTYTVMLVGANTTVLGDVIRNVAGAGAQAMAVTYQWSFTTGILNVTLPPASSPLPDLSPDIDPNSLVVLPRPSIGNDLSQEIDILFPGNIDPLSFNLSDILVSIDPIVGDPSVVVPPGLAVTAAILNNRIKITITGWPP